MNTRVISVIGRIAKMWMVASVGFVLLMAAGELISPRAPPAVAFRDVVGLSLFRFGVCVGMVLAWRWEGLRGDITLGGPRGFHAALRILDGPFPQRPVSVLTVAPGILFLVYWLLSREMP